MRRLAILLGCVATPVLLYVPFRLLAQSVCTYYRAANDDFVYPFAIGLWPTYSLACSLVPAFVGVRMRFRWYVVLPVVMAAIVAWDQAPGLDNYLPIDAGGLSGFRSYPANRPGINTPYISVVATNYAILVGVPLGIFGGLYARRRVGRRARGFAIETVQAK